MYISAVWKCFQQFSLWLWLLLRKLHFLFILNKKAWCEIHKRVHLVLPSSWCDAPFNSLHTCWPSSASTFGQAAKKSCFEKVFAETLSLWNVSVRAGWLIYSVWNHAFPPMKCSWIITFFFWLFWVYTFHTHADQRPGSLVLKNHTSTHHHCRVLQPVAPAERKVPLRLWWM